ncbi:hypothetical protein O1L60_30810 [Streptomyces diastatochromogenes]|nr:hypothetical protein [Streptomyces diastatochromogenes]
MTVMAGPEGVGAISVVVAAGYARRGSFLHDKEGVPCEGAIPDLYGLVADQVLEEAVEAGRLRWSINLVTGETVLSVRAKDSNV